LVQFFQYTNTYTIFAPKDTAYDNLTPDRKQIVDDLTATELETLLKATWACACNTQSSL
jgi:uncharacterized surface protein with fasciclin (FAS1) repeats